MDLESIQVLIRDGRGERHPGRIGDLSFGAEGVVMSIRFPPDEGPALPLGRAAQLGFSGGPFPGAVQAAGLVVSRLDGDEEDLYQLRFGKAAYPVLGVLFEARRAPRVHPPADTTVTVALRSLDGGARPVACELADISAGGMALLAPLLHERQIAACNRVRLGFSLPSCDDPLVLDGQVRHRSLTGSKLLYGIQFDNFEGPGDSRLRRIQTFVDERMVELRDAGQANRRPIKETR